MNIHRAAQRWLDAFTDPRSFLYTFSRCMALADLHADGDYKLILADLGTGSSNIKLKVYKGTSLICENTLLEIPAALVTFHHDLRDPKMPVIALASGSNVFIYKNMKPYFKFSLPALEVNPLEVDLWIQARNDGIKPDLLFNMLQNIKNEIGFSNLSYQSQKYLMIPLHREEELQNALKNYSSQSLKRQTVVTCMCTLYKNSNTFDSISCLVVGTENGWIHIVDSEAFTILESANQSSEPHITDQTVPVTIKTMGLYDVDYRIVIYNRNGKITLLRRNWTQVKVLLQLPIQAVDICLMPDSGNIILALMDSSLECYTKKGYNSCNLERISTDITSNTFRLINRILNYFLSNKTKKLVKGGQRRPVKIGNHALQYSMGKKLWNIKLSSHATGLLPIPLLHQGLILIAVALEGGTLCFYNGREMIDSIMAADTVAGMVFGRFGQEEHCLILITIGGILQVKVLKRTAQFSHQSSGNSTTLTSQNVKLKIPKKTKIFLEQAAREMNNSTQIHKTYQSDLFRFRLETTRAFYESLNRINNSISNDRELPLKLSSEVFGLGPTFKICLTLENMSQTSNNIDSLIKKNLGISFHYNDKIYHVENPYLHVPLLVPGLVYRFETKVSSVTDAMTSDEILVFVISPSEIKPIVSAAIYMPVCDVLPIEV